MSDNVRELIVLPLALLVFLFAAQGAVGVIGPATPPATLAAR